VLNEFYYTTVNNIIFLYSELENHHQQELCNMEDYHSYDHNINYVFDSQELADTIIKSADAM